MKPSRFTLWPHGRAGSAAWPGRGIPLAGCIAALALAAAGRAHALPVAHAASRGASYPTASSLRLPLAGLSAVAIAPAKGRANPRSRIPRSTLRAEPSSPATARGLLTSVPVSAFGFLRDPLTGRPLHEKSSDRPFSQPASVTKPAKPVALAPTAADVVLDGSLGQTQQPVVTTNSNGQNDYGVSGTMGMQIGSNLFFSFSAFNLASQESATFSGPFTLSIPVQNILARVTGGASSINGLISTSKIAGANFFLLNPAGVIFGPNAELDIGGSFVVSTADYIKLADGARFDGLPSANDAGLSTAAVAAFGFVNPTPNGVQLIGSQLGVPVNTGLHVIAGPITLTDATLFAPSGALTMFSASSAGTVPFSLAAPGSSYGQATTTAGGAISLSDSVVAITGQGGGAVTVYGGGVILDDSFFSSIDFGAAAGGAIALQAESLLLESGAGIISNSRGAGAGGNIAISALGLVSLSAGSQISAGVYSSGPGASITVHAGAMKIDGSAAPTSLTGIFAQTSSGSTGDAGDLTVQVANTLTIVDGGEISGNTYAAGAGGNLKITAGNLTIDGAGYPNLATGIFAESSAQATGNAGDITVNVPGLLMLAGGGQISSSTFGAGNGGPNHVTAGALTITGGPIDSTNSTGIFAESESTLPVQGGSSGDVTITVAQLLTISGGAAISTATAGSGSAGNIQIKAGQVALTGGSPGSYASGIFADSYSGGAGGPAGEITINVSGLMTISDGGEISSSTSGSGSANNVQISAGQLILTATPAPGENVNGIFVDTYSAGAGGSAGDISIKVTGLMAVTGSEISSTTLGLSDGGAVTVSAGQLTMIGSPESEVTSGIFANTAGSDARGSAGDVNISVLGLLTISGSAAISSSTLGVGHGGSVKVDTGELTMLGGGEIACSTAGPGGAGSVRVNANEVTISGALPDGTPSGIIASSLFKGDGPAGDITVTVPGLLALSGGGEISTQNFGSGNGGGAIAVVAGQLAITGGTPGNNGLSGIYADTFSTATAGNVTVDVAGALTIARGSEISSTTYGSGSGGSILVNAGQLAIDGTVINATYKYSDPSGIYAESDTSFAAAAGDVVVNVRGALTITNGGEISSSTSGPGRGSDVQVKAGRISISSSRGQTSPSGIFASSLAPSGGGAAGDIHVQAEGLLLLNNGEIASSSKSSGHAGTVDVAVGDLALTGGGAISTKAAQSDAGSILIQAQTNIELTAESVLTASAGENGGNITLTAGNLVYLLDSEIIATAGTLKSPTGGGAGGNITIDPTFIVLDDSLISANAAAGRGGNITLDTENFLSSGSLVTATGTTAGTITITAPELDLTNGLVPLSGSLLQVSSQLRDLCAQRLGQEFSSFLVLGQGGVDSEPDEAQPSASSAEEGRPKRPRAQAKRAGQSEGNR